MAADFASMQWTEQFSERLAASDAISAAASSWIHGPIAFVVEPDVERIERVGIRLDLHQGTVRSVTTLRDASRPRTPFVVSGTIARWRSFFAGELTVVDGALQSRLSVRGDLPTLARHTGLLSAIASTGAGVDTTWEKADGTAPVSR